MQLALVAARSADDDTIAVAEIGGTSVKIGFADRGTPSDFTRTHATAQLRQGDPVDRLAALLQAAIGEAGVAVDRVVVTVPGFIGRDFDTVLSSTNIPELNGIPLASALAARLNVPVRLERDVILQLLGESIAGAVPDEREVLAVYFGTGIGAAYLGEHGIFRGGGWALEIGHMPVRGPGDGGEPPRHIEAYASGVTLVSLAREHGISVADLFTMPSQAPGLGDALDDIIWHQAAAVATATALLSPRIILIGGGVVEMAGYPQATLKQRIGACLPQTAHGLPLDIRWAQLGWQAAIHGAILTNL